MLPDNDEQDAGIDDAVCHRSFHVGNMDAEELEDYLEPRSPGIKQQIAQSNAVRRVRKRKNTARVARNWRRIDGASCGEG